MGTIRLQMQMLKALHCQLSNLRQHHLASTFLYHHRLSAAAGRHAQARASRSSSEPLEMTLLMETGGIGEAGQGWNT